MCTDREDLDAAQWALVRLRRAFAGAFVGLWGALGALLYARAVFAVFGFDQPELLIFESLTVGSALGGLVFGLFVSSEPFVRRAASFAAAFLSPYFVVFAAAVNHVHAWSWSQVEIEFFVGSRVLIFFFPVLALIGLVAGAVPRAWRKVEPLRRAPQASYESLEPEQRRRVRSKMALTGAAVSVAVVSALQIAALHAGKDSEIVSLLVSAVTVGPFIGWGVAQQKPVWAVPFALAGCVYFTAPWFIFHSHRGHDLEHLIPSVMFGPIVTAFQTLPIYAPVSLLVTGVLVVRARVEIHAAWCAKAKGVGVLA